MANVIAPKAVTALFTGAASDRLYRDVLQALPVAVYTTDAEGLVTFCNDAAVELAGRRPEPGQRWSVIWKMLRLDGSILPPEESPLAMTLKTGAAVSGVECIAERPDGSFRPYMQHPEPLFDNDGVLIGAVNILVDLTGQKNADNVLRRLNDALADLVTERTRQAEETATELHRSERSFGLLVRSVVDYAIYMLDMQGNVANWNAGAERIKGYAADEIVGQHFSCFYTPEDRTTQLPQRALSAARREGRYVAEGWRLRKNGTRFWASVVIDPIYDDGELIGFAKVTRDITERKNAELALIESERIARGVIDSALDGFVQTDADDRIVEWNAMAESIFGWSRKEVFGRRFAQLVMAEADQRRYLDNLPNTSSGSKQRWQTSALRRDGSAITVELGLSLLRLGSGSIVNVFVRDLTDRISIEAQLRQSQKMEAMGQLTGGIAHDFNNLLQGITGALELVGQRIAENRTDNMERFVNGALASAKRAAALTHRLLAFSRRQPLDPRPIAANPLVESMEDLLRRTTGAHIDIVFDLADDVWATHCDTNQLENAVLNLAINARDAMPDGGRLTISTHNVDLQGTAADRRGVAPGQYVCVVVSDTGVGMPPEVIERAFDPFFTTKAMGQGTGLGLSMVYGFAGQSKGYCKIESVTDRGTSVSLYLPRHMGPLVEDEPVSTGQQPPLQSAGEVVLVVEDEVSVRELIVHVLHDLGYLALEAVDGVSGLEILKTSRHIDLLVTDIGLPGLNGRQMADAARVDRPALKVLLMTGYAESVVAPDGSLEPGMELITKPFTMEALATRIRAMIQLDLPAPTAVHP
ncbi:PAS domain S-box protein [Rhodanobacter sp. L36]|uniref:PAS domain S-box protein n=1 Tax=Rhodanobacter sp. L36 TaxID=1747221 RepID=UPI00131DF4A3|nr:PAS domain S-box protein [Rhodanobacter sp. L36]